MSLSLRQHLPNLSQDTSKHSFASPLRLGPPQSRAVSPPSDWDLHKARLCFPPQAGFSRKKGLQMTVVNFLPQTGLSGKQAMPPHSDWGPFGVGQWPG